MLDSFHLTPVSTRDVRNFISVCTLALQFIVCIDSQCFQSCLFLPHQCQLPEPSSAAPVCATSIESPPLGHHLTMATEYHAFFLCLLSPTGYPVTTSSLMGLCHRATTRCSLATLYPLSLPEQKAMEEYISKSIH